MADLENLHVIAPEIVQKIKEQGITTIEKFYSVAKHPDTRLELSTKIGVDTFTLEEWSSAAGNYIIMAEMLNPEF